MNGKTIDRCASNECKRKLVYIHMEHQMGLRFITKTIHAYLDYPVAITLMVAPFVLQLGESQPLALWLSVATGIAAFVLTVLTDHHLGIIRVLPYWVHLTVDGLVGVVFLVAPFALGFKGLDAWFYWANAAAVLTVVSLHKPQASFDSTQSGKQQSALTY